MKNKDYTIKPASLSYEKREEPKPAQVNQPQRPKTTNK